MNAQATLTAYPLGGMWCDARPKAAAEIVRRADQHNKRTGKPASIRTIVANMLAEAWEFGLVPGDSDKFGANHNDLREVAFFLEEQYGVRFTRRGPDPQRGKYTQATPSVEVPA